MTWAEPAGGRGPNDVHVETLAESLGDKQDDNGANFMLGMDPCTAAGCLLARI